MSIAPPKRTARRIGLGLPTPWSSRAALSAPAGRAAYAAHWTSGALIAFLWCASIASIPTIAAAQLSPERMQEHLLSFDEVRATIEARYPHPERLDDTWNALADSLRGALPDAASDADARGVLARLASAFGESHFQIIPADNYDTLYDVRSDGDDSSESEPGDDETGADGADQGDGADDEDGPDGDLGADEDEDDGPIGGSGVTIRLIDDQAVVLRVDPGSSGQSAGLRPGDEIVAIDHRTTAELIEIVHTISATSPSRYETTAAVALQSRFTGTVGDSVDLRLVRDGIDTTRTALTFRAWDGVVTQLGALPPQTVSTHAADLGDAGLIRFSLFLAPGTVMPFFEQSLETFRDKKGLIIDMRGNLGGLLPMIQGVVGWFVAEPTQLGRMTMRGTDLKLFANPRPWTYTGRIAVLTDELSVSSAEIFSAAMQELGLARVFGKRTAGLALPANIQKLTNGDGFMYVVADYHTADGRRLERTGVTPDVVVDFARHDLYDDPDPVLTAALRWIRSSD